MKILNVRITNGFSGAEKYILYLFKEVKKNKQIKVNTITNFPKFHKFLKEAGLKSYLLKENINEIGTKRELLKFVLNISEYIKAYRKIIKIASTQTTNVIILHSTTEKLFLSPFLKRKKIKLIWLENQPFFNSQKSEIIKMLYKFSNKWADTIITMSKDTKSDLILNGIKKKKIEVLYINIDTQKQKPNNNKKSAARKKWKLKKNTLVIAFLGNVNEEKGIKIFINTALLLLKSSENYFFVVIGDGKELNWAKEKSKKYKNNFYFTGFLKNISTWLVASDILLLPTEHKEGVPLAILESMAHALCVITTNSGGNREVIHNKKTGIMLNSNKPEIIANTIHNTSVSNIQRMGKAAREYIVNNFNLKKTLSKFNKILQQ